jgi:hypothetical protein
MADELVIRIEDGTINFVYTDELADLCDVGEMAVCRASHVEPHPLKTGWIADMTPSCAVGGAVVLGANGPMPMRPNAEGGLAIGSWDHIEPFKTRQEALAAERAWLTEHKGL